MSESLRQGTMVCFGCANLPDLPTFVPFDGARLVGDSTLVSFSLVRIPRFGAENTVLSRRDFEIEIGGCDFEIEIGGRDFEIEIGGRDFEIEIGGRDFEIEIGGRGDMASQSSSTVQPVFSAISFKFFASDIKSKCSEGKVKDGNKKKRHKRNPRYFPASVAFAGAADPPSLALGGEVLVADATGFVSAFDPPSPPTLDDASPFTSPPPAAGVPVDGI